MKNKSEFSLYFKSIPKGYRNFFILSFYHSFIL